MKEEAEMGWFSRKPTPEKQVEAAVTVASNLYLQTIPGAEQAPAPLMFSLPDSRFRYLLFCLSATVTAVLAYDEKKNLQPEVLFNGCLHFATWAATENAQDYFSGPSSSKDAINNASDYFMVFLKHWTIWPDLEKEGKSSEIIDLICSMIQTTESNEPITKKDMQRLGPLALQIDCRMPTMHGAFTELIKR